MIVAKNLVYHMESLLGCTVPSGFTVSSMRKVDLRVVKISQEHENRVILEELKYILSEVNKSGLSYKNNWQIGWEENLNSYLQTRRLSDLVPKYITKNNVFRIFGSFYTSPNPMFEVDFARLILLHLVNKYLAKSETIVDVGSGSCHYTIWLAQKFKDKTFYALDWVDSSFQIAEQASKDFEINLTAKKFDMFSPEQINFESHRKSVISIGAMEQLGTNFDKMLKWFKDSHFDTVINIEPIIEFYDDSLLYDFVAKEYVLKRNWLTGYYSKLKHLAEIGEIEILEKRRIFGSKFHETYNILVWKFANEKVATS